MKPETLDFLKSRGYTEDYIKKDGVFEVEGESHWFENLELKDQAGYIAWPVRSMAGTLIGIQTRSIEEKKYRWKQSETTHHLPICFGSADDFTSLWSTGEAVIAEGAFDRLAIKMAFPERCVIARLSKGAANQLAVFLARYCHTLWLAFDGDAPGLQATEKTEKRLAPKMNVNVLTIPASDPSKLLEKKGLTETRKIYQKQFDTMGGW